MENSSVTNCELKTVLRNVEIFFFFALKRKNMHVKVCLSTHKPTAWVMEMKEMLWVVGVNAGLYQPGLTSAGSSFRNCIYLAQYHKKDKIKWTRQQIKDEIDGCSGTGLLFNTLSGFISKSETCLSILINDIPVNLPQRGFWNQVVKQSTVC